MPPRLIAMRYTAEGGGGKPRAPSRPPKGPGGPIDPRDPPPYPVTATNPDNRGLARSWLLRNRGIPHNNVFKKAPVSMLNRCIEEPDLCRKIAERGGYWLPFVDMEKDVPKETPPGHKDTSEVIPGPRVEGLVQIAEALEAAADSLSAKAAELRVLNDAIKRVSGGT